MVQKGQILVDGLQPEHLSIQGSLSIVIDIAATGCIFKTFLMLKTAMVDFVEARNLTYCALFIEKSCHLLYLKMLSKNSEILNTLICKALSQGIIYHIYPCIMRTFFSAEKAPKIEMHIIHGILCFRLMSLISI